MPCPNSSENPCHPGQPLREHKIYSLEKQSRRHKFKHHRWGDVALSAFRFTDKDIEQISRVLGVKPVSRADHHHFVLDNPEKGRKLALEIYPAQQVSGQESNLVTVYTPNAHIQLHHCTGYVISESLGEVVFVGEDHGRISGLIVEKEAACSLYSNVDRRILSGDFTRLAPEVMMSSIALSVAEHLLSLDDPNR